MQKIEQVEQKLNKQFTNQNNRISMKRKMNLLVMLVALCGSLFFLAGCQDDDSVIDENINNESSELSMTDDEFEAIVSGKVIYPEDIVLTDKMKEILVEAAEGIGPVNIEVGKIPYYSEEELIRLDKYGETVKEGNNAILRQLNIDPSLPEDEIIRMIEENATNQSIPIEDNYSRAIVAPIKWTYVPHYYEYDNNENPNHYGWCGHAALKCVAKKHGSFKTLKQIHQAFVNNSPGGYANGHCNGVFCAKLQDLYWMAANTNNSWWNYDFPDTTVETIVSLSTFYQRIKDGVDYHKPMIIPSSYGYGSSLSLLHFYPVVGYKTIYNNGSIDYDRSMVYLRDVADPSPNLYYERYTSVRNFYNNRVGNQVLFIKPGLV